jgi:hypothetical protein
LENTHARRIETSLRITFIAQKRDGRLKGRHCADGQPQQQWMSREYVSSSTVSTKSTLITAVIEAKEGRDITTCDIPNAFIQTEVGEKDNNGNLI